MFILKEGCAFQCSEKGLQSDGLIMCTNIDAPKLGRILQTWLSRKSHEGLPAGLASALIWNLDIKN